MDLVVASILASFVKSSSSESSSSSSCSLLRKLADTCNAGCDSSIPIGIVSPDDFSMAKVSGIAASCPLLITWVSDICIWEYMIFA
ncbi:unnamed protein product [[Candida] boidinii]|nr:unnamed protein product [[Candida] boidinii]